MATPDTDGHVAETTAPKSKLNPSMQGVNRPSFTARMSDSTRRVDDEARRAPPQKAWTSGLNPITQRPGQSSQVNGINNKSGERLALDRQGWVYGNAVGLECTLVTKSGKSYTGIFVGVQRSKDDQRLVLKMVKDLAIPAKEEEGGSSANASRYCGHGLDHKMIFLASSVQKFEVPPAAAAIRVSTANGGFRTDADISGNQTFRERNLQRWEAPNDTSVDLSLESSLGGWDQFKANETRFGIKSDYDENIYTTQIDRSNPLYVMRERQADRIARDIEGSASTNAHIREERGVIDDGDDGDEEEKYSGVRRDFAQLQSSQPNRYIPPSRRNILTANTIPSASGQENEIDPAIISSQIARPLDGEANSTTAPAATATETSASSIATDSTTAASTAKEPKNQSQPAASGSGGLTSNNIEQKVLDSFHQFSAIEKIRIQDQKRTRASADKAVRINDLMKFSKNFKLLTPVPKDLVPILAKDEARQREIVQKAQQNAESTQSSKIATLAEPHKANHSLASARWDGEVSSTAAVTDRTRQPSAPQPSHPGDRLPHPPVAPASLSAKLSDHHRAHKAGNQTTISTPLPLHDQRRDSRTSAQTSGLSSPQKAPSVRGPGLITGAKLNVKAMEFKPTATPFKPGPASTTAAASSPRSGPTTRTLSPAGIAPKFFADGGTFKNAKDRPTPHTLAKQKRTESHINSGPDAGAKAAVPPVPPSQGGFPFPYRTAPTWIVLSENEVEADYKVVFNERRPRRFPTPHSHPSPAVGIPHHFQAPQHLPGGPQMIPHMQQSHHAPQQMQPQSHYGHQPQYDDHHMRPSHSSSSHYPTPSPRMQQPSMGYPSPMPGHAQITYPGMPYPVQTPPMGGRQFSNGPPIGQMQTHLAPMMVPQHSPGGFMPQQMSMPYNGQMPMYASPVPAPTMYGSPNQQSSGFPSPGRAAPMMVQQGSQQGHQPMFLPGQYPQPMYPQQPAHMMRPAYGSPQPSFSGHPYPQQHQFPQQVHRTPSQGYAQPQHTPQQQHAVPQPQGAPQPTQSADMGDEGK